jgi:uncharacterized protein YndB with AHSA1/START domain
MAHLDIRRFIAAAPEHVWEILADLEHQARWMVDVCTLEIVSAQTQGVGTVLRVTSELFGQPVVKDVMEVTVWEPPYRMGVAHNGQFSGTGWFALERIDNGTIFTWTEDFAPPLGPLGEAAFALAVRPHLRRVFARSMANLARLAEEAHRQDAQNTTA